MYLDVTISDDITRALEGYEAVELALKALCGHCEPEVTVRTDGIRGLWRAMVNSREELEQAQMALGCLHAS